MLKNIAIQYYRKGFNCSQCIIKACSDKYNLKLPKECLDMCKGVYNGFGTGGICSVLVACIMIISFMYPEDVAHRRILVIDGFVQKMGSINCGSIREQNCENVINNACDILEEVISNR